jgi:hypothetical protein
VTLRLVVDNMRAAATLDRIHEQTAPRVQAWREWRTRARSGEPNRREPAGNPEGHNAAVGPRFRGDGLARESRGHNTPKAATSVPRARLTFKRLALAVALVAIATLAALLFAGAS